ncbi:MAG: DUF1385 domain-containing protein [Myxococcaceae bacterium]
MSDTPQRPYIGGQAVIEGVMMRSPKSFVTSVRTPNGKIAVREQDWETLLPKLKFLRWPIFRGAVVLAESLHNGFTALKFSGDYGLPEEQGGKKQISVSTFLTFVVGALAAGADADPSEGGAPKKESSGTLLLLATIVMAAFFIALPHALTWLVGRAFGPGFDTQSGWFHLVDGGFRIVILVGYMWALSKTKDAHRLFEYHGAEHKAIWAYEKERPLTVPEAQSFTTRHPRCGTSFLFLVVGVAVMLHLVLLPWIPKLSPNELVNQALMILIKLPMAFPIAGVAYELQRWSAKPSCPSWVKMLVKPGIWLQGITTQPPADGQQELALVSLDRALQRENGKARGDEGIHIFESFETAKA